MSREGRAVGVGRQEMLITDKAALETAFRVLHAAGGRFSTLVVDIARYAGYRVEDLADAAALPVRNVRSCLQGRAVPTHALRRAMEAHLGFDPWQIVTEPNLPPRNPYHGARRPSRCVPPDASPASECLEEER